MDGISRPGAGRRIGRGSVISKRVGDGAPALACLRWRSDSERHCFESSADTCNGADCAIQLTDTVACARDARCCPPPACDAAIHMIRFEGVTKAYKGEVTALKELSLEILKGELGMLSVVRSCDLVSCSHGPQMWRISFLIVAQVDSIAALS
jgi:hypothetical protein